MDILQELTDAQKQFEQQRMPVAAAVCEVARITIQMQAEELKRLRAERDQLRAQMTNGHSRS